MSRSNDHGLPVPLKLPMGLVLAYLYRQDRPCYASEVERGAPLSNGRASRIFDRFSALGWVAVRTEPFGSAHRKYAELMPDGVEALRRCVYRFGDALGDLSTLPEPTGERSEREVIAMALGQVVRGAYLRSGLTVRVAAPRVGKSTAWLTNVMAGNHQFRVRSEEAARLAEALSMSDAETERLSTLVAQVENCRPAAQTLWSGVMSMTRSRAQIMNVFLSGSDVRLTASDVARVLSKPPQHVHKCLAECEVAGWFVSVYERRGGRNMRHRVFALTDPGRAVAKSAVAKFEPF